MRLLTALWTALLNKPAIGAKITGGTFGSGLLLRMGYTPDLHHMINDYLQSAAFIMTLVVGFLTVLSWIKKNREKK